jgi:hypothetical protein
MGVEIKMKTKIVIFALLAFLTLFLSINAAQARVIELTYDFDTPTIAKGFEDYDVVAIPGLSNAGSPGYPVLPFKTAKVLIPYGEELEDIDVITGKKVLLGTDFFIDPGQAPIPLSFNGSVNRTPPNGTVYNSTEEFPCRIYSSLSIQEMRGYEILLLNLYPVQYIPKPGEISYYENMTVVVSTKEQAPKEGLDLFRGLPEDRARVLEIVDNPQEVNTYSMHKAKNTGMQPTSIVDPTESYDYVIITNDALNFSSGAYTFQNLADWKNQKGVETTIVTVEQIISDPDYHCDGLYGDGCAIPQFDDTQARIRNFIKDAYTNWGIEYVLLGGDGDGGDVGGESGDTIIPHRGFSAYGDGDIPADLYYATLDGNWNSDCDSLWGEPGEEDFYAEVFVGRAPVDSEEELSNFVMKTIAYESSTSEYLEEAWMVGEDAGHLGYTGRFNDEIKYGSNANGYTTVGFPDEFDVSTLYDRDYPGNNWSKSVLIDIINDGTHIINHVGHADVDCLCYVKGFCNDDIDALTNNEYLFGYTQGCYSGAFDNRHPYGSILDYDCALEHFTTTPHGAFAFIGNSRYGWGCYPPSTDAPSQHYDRQFWDAVFGENIINIGKANQDSKKDNIGFIINGSPCSSGEWPCTGVMRYCYYEINLFGDPETPIHAESVPPSGDILLVDDDQGASYETYYKNALDASGYQYSYCSSPPDASVLSDYAVVIISGQDIGYDIGGTSFYTDYLHANYIQDYIGIYTLNGVTGCPIGDGLSIGISGGDGANNQNYQSEISPRDGSASAVFNYAGDGCGAIKADTGTYQVVYFAYGFEAINNAADRNTVMDRVMSWLDVSTGGPLWTRYSSRIDTETQCLGLGGFAIDSEDNVIIASNRDVIKYDSGGNLLWEYDMCGCGVVVDKTDDSVIVGLCNSSITKFSKTGSILWTRELQEDLYLSGAKSVNPSGDILVSGFGRVDGVFQSYYEIRDKNGNFIRSITRPQNGWWPSAAFAESGYIYLAYDLAQGVAIEKVPDDFSSTLWTATLHNCSQYVSAMGVDSENNLFARGTTGVGGVGYNQYTVKINGANGDLMWEEIYDSGYQDFGGGLNIDSANDVLVIGSTDYETGGKDRAGILMIKYDGSDGTELKHILYRKSPDDERFEVACGIVRDSNGYVYIGGKEYDISAGEGCGIETRRALTIKYDSI